MRGIADPRREEAKLLRAAKRGSRGAFDSLAANYRSSLTKFLSRRANGADVDDVLQETWLAAWEGIRFLDEGNSFRAWLFAIGLNKLRDAWRRMARSITAELSETDRPLAYMPNEFAVVELREAIRPVWESLTRDQRELLDLYYAEGMTLKEISVVLARNLNTVKYQFYRAHEQASEALQPDHLTRLLSTEVER